MPALRPMQRDLSFPGRPLGPVWHHRPGVVLQLPYFGGERYGGERQAFDGHTHCILPWEQR